MVPFALWSRIFVVATIIFLVLTLDASLTGDPRIALFQQGECSREPCTTGTLLM
jgi:hypothetical protein